VLKLQIRAVPAAAIASVVALGGLAFAGSAQAAFPGLNGRIAFAQGVVAQDPFSFTDQIVSVNPDGSAPANLSNDSSQFDNTPVYSADGKMIAFSRASDFSSPGAIWVMNADGSGKRQLTTPPSGVGDLQPAFSPDGRQVVFERSTGERVFVVNIDGSNQHQLLTPPANFADENATYSPDGSKIAFMREPTDDSGGQIMLANADGSGATALTNPPSGYKDGDPNFSPDGTKITFGRSTVELDASQSKSDVYVINSDATGEQNLTNNSAPTESADPAFSPDGTLIVFTRTPGQLFTMRVDGTGKQAITPPVNNQFIDSPNWQPLANVTSTAQIPPCVPSGAVTVTVGDTTGFKSPPRGVRYRLDFSAEQVALTNGGSTATIALPAGRHELEYWGQNQAGDQEAVHHNVVVTVDQTRPTVVILRDQGRSTFRRGQFASVTIRASDAGGAGLVRNPSRRRLRVSTFGLGTHTVRATATDACGNSTTARLTYRVVKAAVAHRRVTVRPRFTG
jgi:TolB protein